ncbi:hypothetical protein [Bradyrhizobium sp.]|uniref:hypothetical protein n=1 Tax=Bradyrhizobium sp. TaxID=376 RepID=UPI0007C944C7|nr:hypothetical protein [Bradyrhizobium sp.]
MSIANLSDESVLRLYSSIREQVTADRSHGGLHRLLGDTAKQRADVLREEIERRRLQADRIEWS